AYGVSCRARTESVALRHIQWRFAPEAVTSCLNLGSPAPQRHDRWGFGVMSRSKARTLADASADSFPRTGELGFGSLESPGSALCRRGSCGVRREFGRSFATVEWRAVAARYEVPARARSRGSRGTRRVPGDALFHPPGGPLAGLARAHGSGRRVPNGR